uniref:hypothetical protein n=1 Tax=Inquilinus sp. OTU3971 TaxID=3043855 RepID=UPI00313D4C18
RVIPAAADRSVALICLLAAEEQSTHPGQRWMGKSNRSGQSTAAATSHPKIINQVRNALEWLNFFYKLFIADLKTIATFSV